MTDEFVAIDTPSERHVVQRRIEDFWHERATGAVRKILTGATLAFCDLGYHGASTREIASRSGMSPSAVYIHFASKEDLFLRIAVEGHRASTGAFIEAGNLGTNPASRLRLAVASFAAWNAEMNVLSRMIEYEMRQHTGEKFAEVARMRRGIEAYLREILDDGVRDGSFHMSNPEDTKIIILSLCIDIARWYRLDSGRTPTALGVQRSDLVLSLAGAG